MPPPEPWALVATDYGELLWFNQLDESIAEQPPHLDEILERLDKARKKSKIMKNRN